MHNGIEFRHYYHIYAAGAWHVPYTEHIRDLTTSGLIDKLDFVGIGIVGSEAQRQEVKDTLPSDFKVIVEADKGWEQVTMVEMEASDPSYILYAHTKGAANRGSKQDAWRRQMSQVCIKGWEFCATILETHDAAGCRWLDRPWYHYSGTYWWATSEYFNSLPPVLMNTRFDAEAWIGRGVNGGRMADITPGLVPRYHLEPQETSEYITFVPNTTIAGYRRGVRYTVKRSAYIENNIAKGHFSSNDSPEGYRTFVIAR